MHEAQRRPRRLAAALCGASVVAALRRCGSLGACAAVAVVERAQEHALQICPSSDAARTSALQALCRATRSIAHSSIERIALRIAYTVLQVIKYYAYARSGGGAGQGARRVLHLPRSSINHAGAGHRAKSTAPGRPTSPLWPAHRDTVFLEHRPSTHARAPPRRQQWRRRAAATHAKEKRLEANAHDSHVGVHASLNGDSSSRLNLYCVAI